MLASIRERAPFLTLISSAQDFSKWQSLHISIHQTAPVSWSGCRGAVAKKNRGTIVFSATIMLVSVTFAAQKKRRLTFWLGVSPAILSSGGQGQLMWLNWQSRYHNYIPTVS